MFALISLSAILASPMTIGDVKEMEGRPLPKFEMTTIDGKSFNNEKLQGKVAVIDFWATWCGPCKKASPVMQSLFETFKSKGLIVIGANGFENDPGAKPAADYAKEHNFTYTFTHTNDKLMEAWGITGIPTILVVDKSGNVAKVQVGFSAKTGDQLKQIIERLLN